MYIHISFFVIELEVFLFLFFFFFCYVYELQSIIINVGAKLYGFNLNVNNSLTKGPFPLRAWKRAFLFLLLIFN